MVVRINHNIAIHPYRKIMLLLVILLFLSDNQTALVSTVEVVKHLHNVAMATVLFVEHHSEIVGNSFIQSFEEAFLVKLCITVIDLFRDDIFVQSLEIGFSHMTKVVHRRKLTVVPDKNNGFAVENRDQQIKERRL